MHVAYFVKIFIVILSKMYIACFVKTLIVTLFKKLIKTNKLSLSLQLRCLLHVLLEHLLLFNLKKLITTTSCCLYKKKIYPKYCCNFMKPIDMTNAYKLNFHYKNIYYYFI